MNNLIIYSDGGARGNPGPAAAGVVITDEQDNVLATISQTLGDGTNNYAEYQALILGLTKALKLGGQNIQCFLDSELVVRQLNLEYKVKETSLKDLYIQVLALKKQFHDVRFAHIPREKNKLADQLVNDALDRLEIT